MNSHTVGRPMEILLVEDSLVDARVTIGALRKGQIQHRLTLIRDGVEAVEFLRREGKFARAPRPDLILLDLLLPKRDGFAVLADLRADDALKNIPVVVLTASQVEEDRLQCELHHVASYITKPVNLDKFLALVKKLKRYWLEDVILPSVE
jgi:CheY-like chemotaxis protein